MIGSNLNHFLEPEEDSAPAVDQPETPARPPPALPRSLLLSHSGEYDILSVRWLDLSGLRIDSIDGLGAAANLQHLVAARNAISSIGNQTLPKLAYLDLSHNAMASIEHATFSSMPSLRTLNLYCNKIEHSAAGVGELGACAALEGC